MKFINTEYPSRLPSVLLNHASLSLDSSGDQDETNAEYTLIPTVRLLFERPEHSRQRFEATPISNNGWKRYRSRGLTFFGEQFDPYLGGQRRVIAAVVKQDPAVERSLVVERAAVRESLRYTAQHLIASASRHRLRGRARSSRLL